MFLRRKTDGWEARPTIKKGFETGSGVISEGSSCVSCMKDCSRGGAETQRWLSRRTEHEIDPAICGLPDVNELG